MRIGRNSNWIKGPTGERFAFECVWGSYDLIGRRWDPSFSCVGNRCSGSVFLYTLSKENKFVFPLESVNYAQITRAVTVLFGALKKRAGGRDKGIAVWFNIFLCPLLFNINRIVLGVRWSRDLSLFHDCLSHRTCAFNSTVKLVFFSSNG